MRQKGSITVFLTLMLSVMSAFILMLAKSARGLITKSEAALATDNAIRSCFAEYNKELFDRFHILLADSSFKTAESGPDRIREHFYTYLENSMTQCELQSVDITDYKNTSDHDGYLYESAVKHARSHSDIYGVSDDEEDEACFRAYLMLVLGTDELPVRNSYRKGEVEYLIYGAEQDDENIMWAHMDHESDSENTYEDFLRQRLAEEDTETVMERFKDLMTEYMRNNGSPGFDLENCFYDMTFLVSVKSRTADEYHITRKYAYEP